MTGAERLPDPMRRVSALAAALASGALTALALPLVLPFVSLRQLDPAGHLEALAWVSLVPAFLALRACRRARQAVLLGLAAGLGHFYVAIHWVSHAMTAFGGLSLAFSLFALTLLVLYMAAHWALAFGAAAFVRTRLGRPVGLLVREAVAYYLAAAAAYGAAQQAEAGLSGAVEVDVQDDELPAPVPDDAPARGNR